MMIEQIKINCEYPLTAAISEGGDLYIEQGHDTVVVDKQHIRAFLSSLSSLTGYGT